MIGRDSPAGARTQISAMSVRGVSLGLISMRMPPARLTSIGKQAAG